MNIRFIAWGGIVIKSIYYQNGGPYKIETTVKYRN